MGSAHISSYSDGNIVNALSRSLRNALRFSISLRFGIKSRFGLKSRLKRLPNDSAQLRSHTLSGSDLPSSSLLLQSSTGLLSSKIGLAFLPLLLLPWSFTTQALSATTAQRIEGTKPYIVLTADGTKLTNLTELMGFSMPDGSGGIKQIDTTMSGTALAAPAGMKFSDINVAVLADGNQHTLTTSPAVSVDDDDGDASSGAITGNMTAT